MTVPAEAMIKELYLDDSRRTDSSLELTGLRILYVEDDIDSREALAAVLLLYGAEIKCVPTVHEALGLLTEWKPDVLVSDIGLPIEDGYDLIKKVRTRLPGDGGMIPAIALTGYAGVTEHELALSAGYQTYLVKPIEAGSLVEIITTLVRDDEKESSRKTVAH